MLWDMFVFTWKICFFSFVRKKKKRERGAPHFDLISYKAPMGARGRNRVECGRNCVVGLGGVDSVKALGDVVTLCFVYRVPAQAR